MEIRNEFDVSATTAEAWDLLLDVPRVVPCVPGAELTDVVDDKTYKGKMAVKLGPIRLTFAGEVHLEEVDEAARRVEMSAQGRETRGKGNAQAKVSSVLTPAGEGTRIALTTDLKLSGPVAQYGRGMIQDVSSKLVDQFAQCLATQLTAPPPAQAAAEAPAGGEAAPAPAPSPAPAPAQKPVQGLSLLVGALWQALRRLFTRVVRRG
jgi:carbon monoxide dehydrogenase subunit G